MGFILNAFGLNFVLAFEFLIFKTEFCSGNFSTHQSPCCHGKIEFKESGQVKMTVVY